MSNATALNKIRDALSASYFDVIQEDCVTASGKVVPGKKVICRKDNGTPLAVVGDRYKMVTNEEIFSGFTNILGKSSLDLTGSKVNLQFSHGGARTYAEIIIPEHSIKVGPAKVGDLTQFRLIARNSYDGSTAFIVQAGGYRLACLNGQVMPADTIGYFQSKHVSSLDVGVAADNISQVLNSFNESREWFNELRTRKVTDAHAYACLAFASRNQEAFRQGYPKSVEEMPRMMKTLFESWTIHRKEMGDNAWALYNTLTHFSSHWGADKEEAHDNAVAAQFRREDRVRETLQSPVWLKLAA